MSARPAGRGVALDVGRRLMAFNWLAAGYAHRDWLGPWSTILEPRERASLRLVRRASIVLLDRLGLRERYVRELSDNAWIVDSHDRVKRIALELGTAMLGGWVRNQLTRTQVALQLRVLGSSGRTRALGYASRFAALPFPLSGAWPIAPTGAATAHRLGVSCLAALLESELTGARERFLLRFPADMACSLLLSPRQRDEALSIIYGEDFAAG